MEQNRVTALQTTTEKLVRFRACSTSYSDETCSDATNSCDYEETNEGEDCYVIQSRNATTSPSVPVFTRPQPATHPRPLDKSVEKTLNRSVPITATACFRLPESPRNVGAVADSSTRSEQELYGSSYSDIRFSDPTLPQSTVSRSRSNFLRRFFCRQTLKLQDRTGITNLHSSQSFLSSWKSEWGPGQRLSRRRRLMFFRRSDGSDKPPGGFFQAIKSFRRVSKHLRTEKLSHLLKAARALGSLQEAAGDPYPPRGLLELDLGSSGGQVLLSEIQFHFILSIVAYPPSHINKYYGLKVEACDMPELAREILTGSPSTTTDDVVIIDYLEKSAVNRPAYCLVVDHSRHRIFLVIRGSIQFSDIATDVQCEVVSSTRTHDGFERAAAWFDENLKSIVVFLRQNFRDYQVTLCGHSLGGAVASLLCMRWLAVTEISGEPPLRPMLQAYSFGAPCVCTVEVSANFSQHIISVTNGRDIVSRLSQGSVDNMAKMLLRICEHTRSARETYNQDDILDSVKDAKKICGDAQHLGRAHKMAYEDILDVVHDAAEYLETVLQQKAEDTSSLVADHFARRHTKLSSEDRANNQDHVENPPVPSQDGAEKPGRRQKWMQFLTGMKGVRKPLVELLTELRSLMDADDKDILVPAGLWFMFIPAIHFVIAGLKVPSHLGAGGFGMFDVTHKKLEICREMVFRRRAMQDHFPYFINFAIGCPLAMGIPDTLANEMEKAISLGIAFAVRPEWTLPHFGLRHRRLKARQNEQGLSNVKSALAMPEIVRKDPGVKPQVEKGGNLAEEHRTGSKWMDISGRQQDTTLCCSM